jgi:hypothetical protein
VLSSTRRRNSTERVTGMVSRRGPALGAGLLLVPLAVVVLATVATHSDAGHGAGAAGPGAPTATAAGTATAGPGAPTATGAATPSGASGSATATAGAAGPAPAAVTAAPSVALRPAPAVGFGQAAEILPAVSVTVTGVAEVTVGAKGPGEVAGPAVAVHLTVRNASARPFPLGGLVVTATYGGGVPGDETDVAPSRTLTGSLPVGGSASGVYVFRVPAAGAADLRLDVTSGTSPTILRFHR